MNADAGLHQVIPEFDVIIVADMRGPGDAALRISHEIRIQHAHGFKTALLHLPSGRVKAATVRGEIQACVGDGMAQVLTPFDQVKAKLMPKIRDGFSSDAVAWG